MQKLRCLAKRRNRIELCQSSPMKNGRCRLHGGLSTGPKSEEGKVRSRKGNYKHGLYSIESRAVLKLVKKLAQGF